ncbi:PEGA domain-containing protein [Candidatus Woesebacteria bacterium]|nr:PEGA domain-containing protein [Candidatus Woesebacteria bacterium]
MKRKLLFILVILFVFALFLAYTFLVPYVRNSTGKIKIESSPTTEVVIDGAAVGKSPYNGELSVGDHTVKLIPEGGDSKAVIWEGTVSINKNALTYMTRELGSSELTSSGIILTIAKMDKRPNGEVGEVAVESEPTGAIIYIDNDDRGVAPTVVEEVPAGDHELSLFLPGFFRKTQKINIEKGYRVSVKAKLAFDQSHSTLEEELDSARKEATKEAETKTDENTDTNTDTSKKTLTILDTPTGFLNVRVEPSLDGEQVTQIKPGEIYEFTEQDGDWYKITLADGTEGWVFGDYIEEN